MDSLTPGTEAGLRDAVEAVYHAFDAERVPPGLEVCQCPVCMTETTRREIIATPVRDLSAELVCEYTNSAHGVPSNPDDLRALLPRYLELIAEDVAVDGNQVGVDLQRFGEGLGVYPNLYSPEQRKVLDDWAGWALRAAAEREREGPADSTDRLLGRGVTYPLFWLVEVLICGGWPVPVVTGHVDALFADPEAGPAALAAFLTAMTCELIRRDDRVAPDWYAMARVSDAVRAEVAAWLNGADFAQRLYEAATSPAEVPGYPDAAGLAEQVLTMSGQFDADLFPRGR